MSPESPVHGIEDYVIASVFLGLLVFLWRAYARQQSERRADAKAASQAAAEERAASEERLAKERAASDQREQAVLRELAAARADFFTQLEKRDVQHGETLRGVTREFADAMRSVNERVMNAVIALQTVTDALGRRIGRREGG